MTKVRALPAVYLTFAAFLYCAQSQAGQSLQQGFYSHEPDGVALRISNASLGVVCGETLAQAHVCDPRTNITVTGETSCKSAGGSMQACTRYGYQYDYQGATPGTTIECQSTRNDGFRKQRNHYMLTLDDATGSIIRPSWIPYQQVERRIMLTEVHECSYQDELLTTIEFIVSYEPGASPSPPPVAPAGGPSPNIDEPYIDTIPNACSYLTAAKAGWIMQANRVQEGGANEHIGNLWSQCTYTSIGAPIKTVGFVFKFMLYELFDVDNLSPMQLTFHATFAAGGQAPTQTIEDLGKISWVFHTGNHTTLMVTTGIQGPPDGASRPREFVASYFLDDPERSHASRLEELIGYAKKHLAEWHARF